MSETKQNREWIEDGVNGFLCPPRDADVIADRIERLLENRGDMINEFVRICLGMIHKDANSSVNVARIKDLVAELASRGLG
jgi:glycosyltransferase involved in cell wall biosynthesis